MPYADPDKLKAYQAQYRATHPRRQQYRDRANPHQDDDGVVSQLMLCWSRPRGFLAHVQGENTEES